MNKNRKKNTVTESAAEAKLKGFLDMIALAEDHSALPEMMVSNMAARLAKLGALSSDPITNPVEAQRLIDSLLACENPEYTSAGRRVIALVPTEEIEKKF